MKSLHDLVARLEALHVELWNDDGYLGYSAAEGVLTDELLDELREHKDVLLAMLREGQGTVAHAPPRPLPHADVLPVSQAQRRLWFLCQLDGASVAYNMPFVTALDGHLDARALQRALDEIIRRHESLRTTFRLQAEGPVQVIHPPAPLDLPLHDLRSLDEPARAAEIQRRIDRAAHQPFDIERGPLLRAQLLRQSETRHVLCLVIHHIVADGWSIGVFVREFEALYGAFSASRPSPLTEPPLQYADFSRWQEERFPPSAVERHLTYWKQKLSDVQPLQLPADHPRPAVESFRGDHTIFRLDRGLTRGLHELAQCEGVTLFITLLSAFNVLLGRYSGQDDLAIASGTANRKHAELEGLIGFFVNTVVIRTDLSGNPTFRTVLSRVLASVMEATEHEDLPFERVVEELKPERTASHNPLAQVALTLQSFASNRLTLPGLTTSPCDFRFRTSKLDLMLLVTEVDGELEVVVEYNTDLFEDATIARMSAHLRTVMAAMVADPGARIGDISLLTTEERHRLLVDWNDTALACPEAEGVHHAFEQNAARQPDAIAVVFDGDPISRITYGALNERANQLAHHLIQQGVGPDVVVGIHVERSITMIVALLAVLKAGGAYLPLDPTYPQQRLAFILADAGAQVILTQEKWFDDLPPHTARVLDLDAIAPQLDANATSNPPLRATADHLAYIIYTSGSTGNPKGVLIPRRDTWSVARALAETYALTPESRVLQFASLNFDGSVVEITMTLFSGAALHVAPQEKLLPGAPLNAFLQRHAITHVQLAPSLLARLPPEGLEHVRTIMVAGEASSVGTVRGWLPGRRILNGYGPTETTVGAAMIAFTEADDAYLAKLDALPIGRPFYNKRVYLLDARLQPVPVGVPGEIYVASPGLARGYINRPAATAEKFLPNPFSETPGERIYRTGDLARYLPDGNLVFLGRVDNQVKLRGLRIELEEIESALKSHPHVGDAAVIVHEAPADQATSERDGKRLVAYVVPRRGWEPEGAQSDHIASWQTLHEQLLDESQAPEDWSFNITGWKSSYTGEALPAAEMRLWVESTVERILAHGPKDVLEIGTGTGLLLARIAPRVRAYLATDFSLEAIRYLETCKARAPELSNVTLLQRMADDFTGFSAGQFDTIVLNSVVQYFPTLDYLSAVIEGALRVLKPGGTLFLGDIRNLALLDAFHASVQTAKASGTLSRDELRYRVQQGVMNENELVIDPRFFTALSRKFPQITHVEVTPKRGLHRNELTLFRYDVALQVGGTPKGAPTITWFDWREEGLTSDSLPPWLSDTLATSPDAGVGLRRVPNARLQPDLAILSWLATRAEASLDAWRARQHDVPEGCAPEALWALETTWPGRVHLSWAAGHPDGSFDLVVTPPQAERRAPWSPAVDLTDEQLSAYVNHPLQAKVVRETLGQELRRYLQDKLPAYMVPTVLIPLPALPLTSNGKLDRRALPAPDIERRSRASTYVAPRNAREETLVAIWSKVLGVDPIGVEDNFFELGGDSILSIQIVGQAKQAGFSLTSRQMFEHQTIAALAEVASASKSIQAEQGLVEGSIPLTPIQRWFFETHQETPDHFNQAILLKVSADVSASRLEQAFHHLFTHHDALRMRFSRTADGFEQVNLGPIEGVTVDVIDLAHLPAAEQTRALTEAATSLQQRLSITSGPLSRIALIHLGAEQPARLLWILHHLVVDGVSWRILLDDLVTVLRQLEAGQPARFPPKTTSFKEWSERLHATAQQEQANTASSRAERDAWRSVPVPALPLDHPQGTNRKASAAQVQVALSVADTHALLHDAPRAYGTQVNDLLLTALALAFNAWTGDATLALDLEGHGREEDLVGADLSRTVGWFTTMHPVALRLPGRELSLALRAVKEQLRAQPGRGIAYGLFRYASGEGSLASWPAPQVNFNYLGQLDAMTDTAPLLGFAPEEIGPSDGPTGDRTHLFQVNGMVKDGSLQFTWTYSRELHRPETVQKLAHDFAETARRLTQHCLAHESHPTPGDFPAVTLSQNQLDVVLDALGADRDNVAAIYPLTSLQEGLLFHSLSAVPAPVPALADEDDEEDDELDEEFDAEVDEEDEDEEEEEDDDGENVYVTQLVFRIQGPLDAEKFRTAWQETVQRHPLLRSRFVWEGCERPLQVVLRSADLRWEEDELEEDSWSSPLRVHARREQQAGMLLDEAPLFRLNLLRAEDTEHHLIWTSHHILLDGWSGPLILKDVFASYDAQLLGESRTAADPPPYEAYVAWLKRQDGTASERFWRENLRGFSAPTPLVVDNEEPTGKQKHLHHRCKLSAETSQALKALAESFRVTLSTVYQAAWALLLHRYSGMSDVLFGVTVSGREADVPGIEEMVGLFIRTVPLRLHVDESQTLGAWLKEVQARQIEQREHQYVSLVDIQRWSDVPGGTQLFDSMFVFENYPLDSALLEQSGLRLTVSTMASPTHYPLVIAVVPGRTVETLFDHDTSRLSKHTVERLAAHWVELLTGMARRPDARIHTLPHLTSAEREKLLVTWNARPYVDEQRKYRGEEEPFGEELAAESTFLDLFQHHVAQTPDALALVGPSLQSTDERPVSRTYRALSARVHLLARHLRGLGVGPEVTVGVCLDRSIELVIGMLAIFEAGGVYLPLDPSQPLERLAYLVSDARPEVVLTQQRWNDRLPEQATRRVALDTAWAEIEAQPEVSHQHRTAGDNLAYVLYTSGSTGTPKGVQVTVDNLSRLTPALITAFDVTPRSRVLQYSSLSFDGSISEVAMALGAGAALHLAPAHELVPGPPLQKLLATRAITHVTLLPAALRWLSPRGLPALDVLIVTGEACPASLVRTWASGRRFVNAYGPTEITVAATAMECPVTMFQETEQPPPIGCPLQSTEIYILDAHLRPVPVGVPGDLYIGGAKLTRGYIHRPALTAERYIPHPFSDRPGARLYVTGDIARYQLDGTIDFLGRRDNQVKVRGYRIELGEVEAALNDHPGVREAVVVAQKDGAGDNRLVAYWAAKSTPPTTTEALRDALSKRLAAYMIPSVFVRMDALPLNATGKIDRQGLPPVDDTMLDREQFVAPRTATEETLTAIWSSTLGVARVGIRDDFFKLGGHSLLALNITTQIQKRFGHVITVDSIFRAPTIAVLARVIDEALAPTGARRALSLVVPLRERGTKVPLFFAAGMGMHAHYLRPLAEHLGEDQPFYALQSPAQGGEITDMATLVDTLIGAIQQIQPSGPYHLGGHSAGARIAFAVALELQRRGAEVPLVSIVDMRPPGRGATSDESAEWTQIGGLIGYVTMIKQAIGEGVLFVTPEELRKLDEAAAWQRTLDAFIAARWMPKDADVEQLQHLCAMNQNVVRVVRDHVPTDTHQGKLLVFSAAFAMRNGRQVSTEGWQAFCANPVTTHEVPGDHMTMLREPDVRGLAIKLRREIDELALERTDEAPGLPTPPEFPVVWEHPEDARMLWVHDVTHCREQMTPLDFCLRQQAMVEGSNLANLAYGVPFTGEIRLINTYVYQKIIPTTASPTELAAAMKRAEASVAALLPDLGRWWTETLLPEIEAHLEALDPENNYDFVHRHTLVEALAEAHRRTARLWEIHFRLLQPVMLAISRFVDLCKDLSTDDDPIDPYALLVGFPNKTTEGNRALWSLSRLALETPEVASILTSNEASRVSWKLRSTRGGRAFVAQLDAYLATYGQRNDSTYLDAPTWEEDPTPVIRNLQAYMTQPERDLDAELNALSEQRTQRLDALRARLRHYPRAVVDEFEQALTAAQTATVLSEDHNYWIDYKITHRLRHLCLYLGEQLKDWELLGDCEEIFYLSMDDVSRAAVETKRGGPFSANQRFYHLACARKDEAKRFHGVQPPRFLGTPSPLPALHDALSLASARFTGVAPSPSNDEKEIVGLSGAKGKARGKARVARNLADVPTLEPGEILVAMAMLPAWTPLFATVAAIVTDSGGMLSHAAVVAREYGIPAVVGTQVGTQRIRDGQLVEVDGERGVVTLL
ncbi:non-ribosomal peptide synthetase [Chondromyces crocatus]|nr:non-ribosomal peptide synthetase [Chondromyces crocatus]AKT40595.1 uncharacterized protein CMC5_047510 [Chondromyces crocatus]